MNRSQERGNSTKCCPPRLILDGRESLWVRQQYELAPDPKELILLPADAHAQYIFKTDQAERLTEGILAFLAALRKRSARGLRPGATACNRHTRRSGVRFVILANGLFNRWEEARS